MRLAKIRLRRILSQADLHAVLTAGGECTSLRRIQKIHRITLDGDQLLMLRAVQTGDTLQKALGIFMLRMVEDLVTGTGLHDTTGIHDCNTVTHARHDTQDINPEISDDEARKITVQQIFFATASTDMDGNLKPYSESSIQSAYEKACEVRDLAVDGEHDFTELASKYSDDSEITYSFGKGEAESAYEEAAFNLATDEVSQVIQCERGYYIIKCTNTLDREETDANKLKIVEERKREVFGQEYDSFVNTLVRQLNDKLWDEITLIMDEQVTTDNFFDVYAKYFPEE